ncbi:hypothetical protein HMPREF0262_01411 [Clostridium sp. ATCC 29733]|nr:hypothetical protein HMPREF0262_01411 [Clostridium sp. ATCC 29733]
MRVPFPRPLKETPLPAGRGKCYTGILPAAAGTRFYPAKRSEWL